MLAAIYSACQGRSMRRWLVWTSTQG